MSPDYPRQTIADSPRKGRYLLVQVSPGPALDHLRGLTARSGPFPFLFFSPRLFLLCLPSVFFFLLFLLKGISIRGIKGTRESKGPFVGVHLWLLEPESDPRGLRKAEVDSRGAFVGFFSGFAMINVEFRILSGFSVVISV